MHTDDHDQCDPGSPRSFRDRESNSYLSECFQYVRDFWWRQGEYWYDSIGKYVGGEYRLEDWPRDSARLWDEWVASYYGVWMLPHSRALRGHVPNVVFLLDDEAEGAPAKEVILPQGFDPCRVTVDATALRVPGSATASAAHVRAQPSGRGRYLSIRLVNATVANVPADAHHLSVVHASPASSPRRRPLAIVHVIRRSAQAAIGATSPPSGAPGASPHPPPSPSGSPQAGDFEANLRTRWPALKGELMLELEKTQRYLQNELGVVKDELAATKTAGFNPVQKQELQDAMKSALRNWPSPSRSG